MLKRRDYLYSILIAISIVASIYAVYDRHYIKQTVATIQREKEVFDRNALPIFNCHAPKQVYSILALKRLNAFLPEEEAKMGADWDSCQYEGFVNPFIKP